jgi:hypothetical protein
MKNLGFFIGDSGCRVEEALVDLIGVTNVMIKSFEGVKDQFVDKERFDTNKLMFDSYVNNVMRKYEEWRAVTFPDEHQEVNK